MSSTTSPKGEGEARKLPPDDRRCMAVGKDEERCKAWAMKGQQLCAGHAGKGIAASPEVAAAAARQSAEVRQGQASAAKRRAVDVFRDAVEENAEVFVKARLAIINDPLAPAGDRLRAMEQLESRALGKPTERVEQTTGETAAQRRLREMSTEELEALVQRGTHLRAVGDEH